jgi:NAD(P)-dependent dehydrogenase (short-subunit alcohol dehydrogenase family)
MAKTIVIVGFGPGNATAIAEKFGAEGFSVALVGRNKDRLTAGVSALKARGITAGAFQGDAADPMSMRAAFGQIRAELGPISVLSWNAALAGGPEAGDIFTADAAAVHRVFDVAVFGLIAAVNEVLVDLKGAGDGAILITNGGFGDPSPAVDEAVVHLNLSGIGLANAAKHKLAGLLAQRLKADGVYVGEVMIYGAVKSSASGNDKGIDPTIVANTFWDLYRSRGEVSARVG